MPHLSGAERGERAGQAGEEGRLGMTGREGQAHGSGGFDDTSGDFEQTKAQGRELGLGQIALFGNGVSDGQHQPIGGGVQDEPNHARNTGCRRSIRGSRIRD